MRTVLFRRGPSERFFATEPNGDGYFFCRLAASVVDFSLVRSFIPAVSGRTVLSPEST